MEERCVVCGAVIPEGRQICVDCEKQQGPAERRDQDDQCERASGEVPAGA